MPQRILLTRVESCQALGISLRTLDNLISQKAIATRRIGRRVLVPRQALEEFACRNSVREKRHAGAIEKTSGGRT